MTLIIFISAGSLQLIQGVRSYMVLLSGITVSVVVLPALLSPDQSLGLDLAWARIQSTFIGVVVGTLLTGIGTPKLQAQLERGKQISAQTIQQLQTFSRQFKRGEPVDALRRQDPEDLPNKVSLARLRRALGQMKRAEEVLFTDEFPFWRTGVPLRRFNPARDWVTAKRNAYLCAALGFSAGLVTYLSQSIAVELAATGVCIFSLTENQQNFPTS